MKKYLFLILILTLSINGYSQIVFEKGYYIDNSNQKVECLIKNEDWRSNPTKFEYKLKENSKKQQVTIKTVKEFGIGNTSKYIRTKVNIDRSSENLENLSDVKAPIFKEEELFLRVLVKGQSSLYEYLDKNLVRFFYNKEGEVIEQLVFKSYAKTQTRIVKNNKFREQLWVNLKCPAFTMSQVENISYQKKSLVRFFIKYNECNNYSFINFEEKDKRDLFNLNVRPGLNQTSLTMQNYSFSRRDVDFGSQSTIRFGLETEFILPFNKNKWAVIVEPTYQLGFQWIDN